MLQNQYSAEFGHSSGGQFNQTIKSGTNQFHGDAFEYWRNVDKTLGDRVEQAVRAG